jgi:hypothetical protein
VLPPTVLRSASRQGPSPSLQRFLCDKALTQFAMEPGQRALGDPTLTVGLSLPLVYAKIETRTTGWHVVIDSITCAGSKNVGATSESGSS